MQRTGLMLALAALGVSGTATAQPAPDLAAMLAADASPGTTALLVEHATRPEVAPHLARTLRHPRPEVRAAATRVIFVIGARELVPAMLAQLGAERTPEAAAELTRAIAALGGPAHDEAIVATWPGLGLDAAPSAAAAFATVRGMPALGALPQLRAVAPRAMFQMIADARPDAATINALLRRAAADGDADLYDAALRVATLRGLMLEAAALADALAANRPPAMRLDAARTALLRWDGAAPFDPALLRALTLDAPLGSAADDTDARLLRELGRRLAGGPKPAAVDPIWRQQIESPGSLMTTLASSPGVHALLTRQERRQLERTLPQLGRRPPPAPTSAVTAQELQLLDAYPTGFIPGVLAATGCDAAAASREGLGAGAGEITLRADGRAARISPIDTGGRQAACDHAVRVLLMNHVADVPPGLGSQRRLAVLPFDTEYLTCREAQDATRSSVSSGGAQHVDPPKKTRHVNPVYPETAQRARVSGVVLLEATIGTAGCVSQLRIQNGVDPRLDLAALLSVIGWRFTPARLDGVVVPVTLVVTVQFTLR